MSPPQSFRFRRLPRRRLGDFVVFRARTRWARLLGLAGLAHLPSGAALELPRTRSVHTFGMRFPIDLVWLDAEGAVLDVDVGVPPGRLRWRRGARSVLECAAFDGVALASTL